MHTRLCDLTQADTTDSRWLRLATASRMNTRGTDAPSLCFSILPSIDFLASRLCRERRRSARVLAAKGFYTPSEGAGFAGRDRNPRPPLFVVSPGPPHRARPESTGTVSCLPCWPHDRNGLCPPSIGVRSTPTCLAFHFALERSAAFFPHTEIVHTKKSFARGCQTLD